MFDTIADEIRYEGRTVATFVPNLQPTFRDMAEGSLYEFDKSKHGAEIAKLCAEHEIEISAKDAAIAEQEQALEQFRAIIDKIEEGQTLLAQLEEAQAEIADLRKRAGVYQQLAYDWREKHAALLKRRAQR